MSDLKISIHPPPGGRLMFATRQLDSPATSMSPTHLRHTTDEFITQLAPVSALDTFSDPGPQLKACMDAATTTEKNFALRAAAASKSIYEWLDELRDWPWPTQGGRGFLPPASPSHKLTETRGRSGSTAEQPQEEDETFQKSGANYFGFMLEADVVRYESRLDQIQAELDKLKMEEIKNHVLHNHIMPLSRPGTPASPALERQLGMASLASFTKMDDMTAVITATVIQALPNLSKLIRLMSTWSVRLAVLRRVPSWLSAVEDAETAVQTGWSTIRPESEAKVDDASGAPISKRDFDVMKLVLEKKVTKAAQSLDFMLDTLEGRDDTLPDDWLDRMEAIEGQLSGWIAACEKILRDAEAAAAQAYAKEVALQQSREQQSNDNSDSDSSIHGDDTVVIHVEQADEAVPSVEDADVLDTASSSQDLAGSPERAQSTSLRSSPQTPPREMRSVSLPLSDMPPVPEDPEDDDDPLETPLAAYGARSLQDRSLQDRTFQELGSPIILSDPNGEDDHMRRQISEVLDNLPAKIQLASRPNFLNPPDLQLPYTKPRTSASDKSSRSRSSMSSRASTSTPSFMLAPVPRPRHQRGNQDIRMYHLSRANGEAPIKLFIRCVGEHGERVMVRVGGGWADLGEYLKEYALHHGRRSNHGSESRLEVRDIPRSASSMSNRLSASPPSAPAPSVRPSPISRPASALDTSPLVVKKTRKTSAGEDLLGPRLPRTPLAYGGLPRSMPSEPPSSGSVSTSGGSSITGRSRSSSRVSWTEEDNSLGMAGPRSSHREIPQESLEWVESIKNKVRAVSGGSDMARAAGESGGSGKSGKFGELGKVGGTKRLFRKVT